MNEKKKEKEIGKNENHKKKRNKQSGFNIDEILIKILESRK